MKRDTPHVLNNVVGPSFHHLLQSRQIPYQLIASKVDRQKDLGPTMRALQHVAQPEDIVAGLGEILAVGGLEDKSGKTSVDEHRA